MLAALSSVPWENAPEASKFEDEKVPPHFSTWLSARRGKKRKTKTHRQREREKRSLITSISCSPFLDPFSLSLHNFPLYNFRAGETRPESWHNAFSFAARIFIRENIFFFSPPQKFQDLLRRQITAEKVEACARACNPGQYLNGEGR